MKYFNSILLMGGVLLGSMMTACEDDLPSYGSDECHLNFFYSSQNGSSSSVTDAYRTISFSFVLNAGPDVTVDTVWLNVETMGYLSETDRPFELQQVTTEGNDAVPDKHYVSFDNSELKEKFYYIPAGEASARIPVVMLRDESLAENDVTLKLTFKTNEYFSKGYDAFSTYTITISDKLTKPSMWDLCSLDYYFGKYGSMKHELMIAWTGNAWNDEYLLTQFYEYTFSGGVSYWYPIDGEYFDYLGKWLQQKLEEENAERLADPSIGDVYREDDGTAVDFTPESYY